MIGLIFGENELPKEILRTVKNKKIKYIIIDLTNKNFFKRDKFSYKVSIGQFGKIIKIGSFRSNIFKIKNLFKKYCLGIIIFNYI